MKIIRQRDYKDCGICSLESIIEHYGGKVSLEQLRIDAKVTSEGTTALNLILTAKKYGFDAVGMKIEILNEIKRLPAIAHMNLKNGGNHYVVIYKILKDKVIIMDPRKGKVILKKQDFYEEWSKIVLLFYPRQKIVVLKKENTLFKIFSKILISEKKLVITIIVISVFLTLASIAGGYYFQVMGGAINNNWDSLLIKILVVSFGFLVTFKLLLAYLRGYLENHLNKNIDCILNADFLHHLFSLPLDVLTSRTTGEIITRVNELTNIKSFITELFISSNLDFFLMLATMPLLLNISSKLFFILLVVIFLYLVIGILSSKVIYKKAYQNIEYEAEFNNNLIEDINMINSIKNLSLTTNRLQHLERSLSAFLYDEYLFNKYLHNVGTLKNIVSELGFFLITSVGFYLIINHSIELVELITFNTLISFFFDPLKNIIDSLPKYNFLKATITKLNDFLSVDEEDLGKEEKLLGNAIKVNNVSYSYDKLKYVLKDFSLDIRPGEIIALTGKSGGGKSTLCKIMDKYIMDYEGEIEIGNINLKDLSIKTIRKNVLYVNQQEALITGTIKDNIILGKNVSMEKLNKVSKICLVDEIVFKKPLRYETNISNEASSISGGEKQRIILARALLNDFKILVLDEALSEVDVISERKIISNIKKEFKGVTIIYVTHKSHLKLFDRVIEVGV